MADIEYLPPGWHWVAAGKETWFYKNAKGEEVASTAKHARRGDETMSLRQAQNIQREERERLGTPKTPSVPRSGKIRTIKTERDLDKTSKGGVSLYSPELHGRQEIYVFRNFADARNWAFQNSSNLAQFKNFAIQIKYTQRLFGKKPGSDPKSKGGHATLGSPSRYSTFTAGIVSNEKNVSKDTLNPWEEAREKLSGYDMSGDNARVYIYASER